MDQIYQIVPFGLLFELGPVDRDGQRVELFLERLDVVHQSLPRIETLFYHNLALSHLFSQRLSTRSVFFL